MAHFAHSNFWRKYNLLPANAQRSADKQFTLLKANPQHPSLQFKKLKISGGQEIWSVRVTEDYRALAYKEPDGFVWFWIGSHARYDLLIS